MHRNLAAAAIVLALVAAACGGDDGDTTETSSTEPDESTTSTEPDESTTSTEPDESTTSTEPDEPVELTASFRGVTEDTIHVGIVSFDWDRLAALGVKFGVTNSGDLIQAAIEAINDRGGPHGRRIEPHLITILPVGTQEADAACVELTADIGVFLVMGSLLGEQVLCYTEVNDTAVLIAGSRTESLARRANAPYVTLAGDIAERAAIFVAEMEALGLLEGEVIGVQGSVDVSEINFNAVVDAFEAAGYDVEKGLLGDNDADLTETVRQQELIYERFVEAGVTTTVSTTGVPLAMVNAINAGYESDQWLLFTTMSGRALRDAGVDPMYLDGAYGLDTTLTGTTSLPDMANDPLVRDCVDDLVARTGHEVYFDLDAETNDLAVALASCAGAIVLEQALWNAGPDLTNETFQAGIEAIGDIEVPGYFGVDFGPGDLGGAERYHPVRFDGAAATWSLLD